MNNDNRRPASGPRRQFFDIARPGRTPASPTSRPVPPSNRPPVQDTSMKPSGPPAVSPELLRIRPKASPPVSATSAQPPAAPFSIPGPAPAPQPSIPAPAATTPELEGIGRAAVDGQLVPGQMDGFAAQNTHDQDTAPVHHGRHSILSEILAILAIILLIAVILNILADAEIINLPIPHTNFFYY